jgi:glycosyltransferase involved in cell wall biosynthesis
MNILEKVNSQSLFIVWGTPDQGPRSKVLAAKLGIDVHFIQTKLPRGALYAWIKYPIQAIKTIWLFLHKKPRIIFVQDPPPLAVTCVWIYCALGKAGYIVDAHSAAFSNQRWIAPPLWLKKILSRHAIATIVTNDHWKQLIQSFGGRAVIIRDIPATFPIGGEYPTNGNFNIAFINTFSEDEPLENFLKAACELPDVHMYVTGKIRTKDVPLVSNASSNVHFTNFLSDETYYALLRSVDAVMCLTTRDHTMQRGACEALSLGKPIITSNWTVLKQYFHKGTVHVDNSAEGIRLGILQMKDQHSWYKTCIEELQKEQLIEWNENIRPLKNLIERYLSIE